MNDRTPNRNGKCRWCRDERHAPQRRQREPAPFPPGDAPPGADLLSDELERLSRDLVYEAAVRAVVT